MTRQRWQQERRLRHNTKRVLKLGGSQQGETVFVIGSGPQLNTLTTDEIIALERRPAIAVNRVQYRVRARYFLSAYAAEIYLATRRLRRAWVLHMRPRYEAPLVRGSLALRRARHVPGASLETEFDQEQPTIRTLRNVALGASHLALIMGARRVVYVGVEQRNALHYYDTEPALKRLIRQDLENMPDKDLCHRDHPAATFDALIERLDTPPETMRGIAFHELDHSTTFADYFRTFERNGVQPFSTIPDSVIVDAGAEYRPLGRFL